MESSPENDEQSLKKFDDLKDFCLLNILHRLDLQSLLNVADTNKRLQSLAADVYQHKFVSKMVSIGGFEVIGECGIEEELANVIQIRGLKASLQYLRCFGPFMHGLSIVYGVSLGERYKHVHEYVNNFCAETLLRIRFVGMEDVTMGQFQKVFANIQDVTFVDCALDIGWSSVVRLFTNLRSLSINEMQMVYHGSIKNPFPNLESLCIERLFCDESTSLKVAADLLAGTNQLKCLQIGYNEHDYSSWSIVELLDLVKGNPSISVLSAFPVVDRVTSAEIQRIISDHPALEELGLEECTFMPDQAFSLILQLGSLKKFAFHTQVNYCSNERAEFAEKVDELGWDLSIGDTGCFFPTMIYDMHVTLTRREQ